MAKIEYAITFARSARKELERLDPAQVNRIFPIINKVFDKNLKAPYMDWIGEFGILSGYI